MTAHLRITAIIARWQDCILRPDSETLPPILSCSVPLRTRNAKIPCLHSKPSHWRLAKACVIAANTTSCPLDHEHEKDDENSKKNDRTSRAIEWMRGYWRWKEETERGWGSKGEAMWENAGAAHWSSRLLSVTWAMACELLFSRDLADHVIFGQSKSRKSRTRTKLLWLRWL